MHLGRIWGGEERLFLPAIPILPVLPFLPLPLSVSRLTPFHTFYAKSISPDPYESLADRTTINENSRNGDDDCRKSGKGVESNIRKLAECFPSEGDRSFRNGNPIMIHVTGNKHSIGLVRKLRLSIFSIGKREFDCLLTKISPLITM